jgi:hypothetical protein
VAIYVHFKLATNNSRPAIDNIFIGFIRYVRDGYRAVVVDCGFVQKNLPFTGGPLSP